jgi:hypothetical protein
MSFWDKVTSVADDIWGTTQDKGILSLDPLGFFTPNGLLDNAGIFGGSSGSGNNSAYPKAPANPYITSGSDGNLYQNAYAGAAQNFDQVSNNPITAQSLYDAGTALMAPQYEKAQAQNTAQLNSMGIMTSGAGYGKDTPYDQTNQNYMQALSNMALQANTQAPVINQQLFDAAYGNVTGLMGAGASYGLSEAQIAANARAQQNAQDAADAQANNGMWATLGQGLGTAASFLPMLL